MGVGARRAPEPSFTRTRAGLDATQTLTIENNTADRVHVRVNALDKEVAVEPGAVGAIDAPINGTVLFVGMVSVTFTPDTIDIAGQSDQLLTFRLLGRAGAARVSRESTHFFDREGVDAFEIDGIIVRLADRQPIAR